MSKPAIHRLAIPSAIAAAMIAVAGCSGGNNGNTNPAEGVSTAPMPAAPAPTTSAGSPLYNPAGATSTATMAPGMAPMSTAGAGDFASQAAQGGMLEIQLADLALQKSDNNDVETFAREMKQDHTAADDTLKQIVNSGEQQQPIPSTLSADGQQTLSSLQSKSGADFNKAYADAVVKNHQEAVALFENAANNASTQQLRDFASQTLPTLKQHLQNAQQLQSKLQGG